MKYDKDSILNDYIQNATIQGESTLSGDYKTGNKAVRKLTKIYKLMEKDSQLTAYILNNSFWHQSVNVRIFAAAHALGLNVMTSEAMAILKEISSRKDTGILGFNAEMTLKVYSEQGYIKFYQDK